MKNRQAKISPLLFLFLLVCFPLSCFASYLSIATDLTTKVDESARTVSVDIKLTNHGDEVAKEVGISIPLVNESVVLAQDLAPQAETKYSKVYQFDQLQIKETGRYVIPFHIVYKDANFYSFSSAQIIIVSIPPSPSVSAVVRILDLDAGESVEMVDAEKVKGTISNLGTLPLEIQSLTAFSALEIGAKVEGENFPIVLKSQESKDFTVKLSHNGALVGSSYGVTLVANGILDGRHFAENTSFTVKLISSFFDSTKVYSIVAGLLILGAFIWSLKSAKKNKS